MLRILSILFLALLSDAGISQAQPRPETGPGDELQNGVFVVTNRVIDTVSGSGIQFLNVPDGEHGLKYLWLGEGPEGYHAVSYPDLASLLERPSKHRDWAVWVHGDGQSFELSVARGMELQELHDVNLIVFAWPTKAPDKGPIGNFRNSRKHVGETSGHLAEFLRQMQEYRELPGNRFGTGHLSAFFHSLGCYLLQSTQEAGLLAGLSPGLFDNLVINAAATEAEGHREWVEQVQLQDRMYIVYNDEDINLEELRALSSLGTQLGERPEGPLAANATYLDFTRSVGFRFPTGATHSYYFATMTRISENIRKTYSELFQGLALPLENNGRFTAMPAGIQVYEVHF